VYMWQLLHCNPAVEWVPCVKVEPGSLWQLVHKALTLSAFCFWVWGSWQAWH